VRLAREGRPWRCFAACRAAAEKATASTTGAHWATYENGDVKRAVDDCMGEFGKIDIVVNNAGVEIAPAESSATMSGGS
jgi:NAD(P)-dependent dehydrogenase (short-subunit alcohol dehydrogenase family)